MKRSSLFCVLTDLQLWVPIIVLISGATLLMMLR